MSPYSGPAESSSALGGEKCLLSLANQVGQKLRVVVNVELALEELAAADVRVLSQPIREQSGLAYAYVAAPDGVVIELTQYGSVAE